MSSTSTPPTPSSFSSGLKESLEFVVFAIFSSNSNDQVVSYNLSEALARPLFDEDFGEHEFFFDFELGPGQFGLSTWKPNVDVQGDYVVVEWNTGNKKFY